MQVVPSASGTGYELAPLPDHLYVTLPNEAAALYKDTFPRKLSGTGLLATVHEHRLAAGVLPF